MNTDAAARLQAKGLVDRGGDDREWMQMQTFFTTDITDDPDAAK
jgi:hypothetical protein